MRLVQIIHLFLHLHLVLLTLLLRLSQEPPLDPLLFSLAVPIPQGLGVGQEQDGEPCEFFAYVYQAIAVGRGEQSAGRGETFPG